ncbi:hypothetical protein Taro_035065 [Colocasia esculenta]|uniref:Uncharacterized protein n=1 Tax=Colocasia esculenta TaxID=4460 RepID=A0A843VY21_COLES|nr:hypothetical protein [Colocasia esculenta]
MVRKLGPRRGARSRATSRPIPAEVAIEQLERRTKRRNDPAEQPGSSSAPQRASKRGRTSTSGRGSHSPNPRQDVQGSSSEDPEGSSSSSESSESQEVEISSESRIAAKHILNPRILDLTDNELANSFPEIRTLFAFQSWLIFISDFPIFYPRLVQEFYKNLKCTKFGYKSVVKGVEIDLPTDLAATLFHAPDEDKCVDTIQECVDKSCSFSGISPLRSTHSSEQVDIGSSSQNSCFVNWDRRSTHSQSVSTQDTFPAVQVANFQTTFTSEKGPNSLRASKKLLAAKKSSCLLPLLSKCFQKTNSHQFKVSTSTMLCNVGQIEAKDIKMNLLLTCMSRKAFMTASLHVPDVPLQAVKRRPVGNRWCLFPSVRKEDLCIKVVVYLFTIVPQIVSTKAAAAAVVPLVVATPLVVQWGEKEIYLCPVDTPIATKGPSSVGPPQTENQT